MNTDTQAAYRRRLLDLRDRLIREVDRTEEALREDVLAPGEHAALPTHPADKDAEGIDEKIAIAQNEEQILEEVETALARLAAGQFGVCRDCGRKLSRQRLDAIPYATCCVDCARRHETEPTRRD